MRKAGVCWRLMYYNKKSTSQALAYSISLRLALVGVTTDAWSGGVRNRLVSSRIVISPGLKGFELTARNMVFKHEFMHAWHRTFMSPSAYNTFSERAASTYSYAYTRAYPSLNWLTSHYEHMLRPVPSRYSWPAFNKIIPLWIN